MARRDPVAAVYARALAEAAGAAAGEVQEAFDAFLSVWRSSPELKAFLSAPHIPVPAKREAVRQALAGAPPVFLNFLCLVLDKGRVSALESIHGAFRDLGDAAAGRVRARASTASPLSPEQAGVVRDALAGKLRRKVLLEESVRPELLGGIRLQVGDLMADGTLLRRLRDLSRDLRSARMPEGAWES